MKIREFTDQDTELMKKWLQRPHVSEWYNPEEWLEEIELRKTEFEFIHHFIVKINDKPIGFCQYYDYSKGNEDWHGTFPVDGCYSLDYLIGEKESLGKGYGPKIVKLLTDIITDKTSSKCIIVQPEKDNIKSRRTLLSANYSYDEKNDVFYWMINR